MAGFANFAAIRTALDAGQVERAHFVKPTTNPGSSGLRQALFTSLWSFTGLPAAGANPGAPGVGTIYTSDASALSFADRVGQKKYISGVECFGDINQSAIAGNTRWIHDRLVGVNVTAITAGTTVINTPALPRYTDGRGVYCWLESITNSGGANTLSLSYTNELGVAGRITPGVGYGNTSAVGVGLRFSLAPGDYGIRSVQSLTITGAGTTSGNLVLFYPIMFAGGVNMTSNETPTVRTELTRRMIFPRIYDGASLMIAYWLSDDGPDLVHRGFVEIVYA